MINPQMPDDARDRVYARLANAVTEAGREREALFLARLALLLCEQLGDAARCEQAIADALHGLPVPSLSADRADTLSPPQPEETER